MKIKPDQTLFLLDADGTITDLKTKAVTHFEIIETLVNFVKNGSFLAITTGRSIPWVDRTIVKKLIPLLDEESKKRILVVGEFGAVWKSYFDNKEFYAEKYFLPTDLYQKVSELASKYTESMFVDTEKKSMLTMEMKDNYSFEDFKKDRDELIPKINILLKEGNYFQIGMNPTAIALDVKNINLNKTTATLKVFEYLNKNNINLIQAISAGDNPFDAEMAEVAAKKMQISDFVFLGEQNLEDSSEYQTIRPKNKYSEGLLEFLRNITF